MIKIASIVRSHAYYPEIYAYKDFFDKFKNVSFTIIESDNLSDLYMVDTDCYIVKMGADFFLRKRNKKSLFIHDYTSCSTGKFPRLKNKIKKYINFDADIKLFLNHRVMHEYGFKPSSDHLIRDMGIDEDFFYKNEKKGEHEFIYAGAIDSSRNMDLLLNSFSLSSNKLTLIGTPEEKLYDKYKKFKNIVFLGRLSRKETAEQLKKAIFGVNITPAIYPFDFQTSTKTLEYCAAGLKVICNRNLWNKEFEIRHNARFYYTEDFILNDDIYSFSFEVPNVRELSWHNVINNSELAALISSKLDEKLIPQ